MNIELKKELQILQNEKQYTKIISILSKQPIRFYTYDIALYIIEAYFQTAQYQLVIDTLNTIKDMGGEQDFLWHSYMSKAYKKLNPTKEEEASNILKTGIIFKQFDHLWEKNQYQLIIDTILAFPKEYYSYGIIWHLARTYISNKEPKKGIDLLLSIKEKGKSDARWYLQMGHAYYALKDGIAALESYQKAYAYRPDEDTRRWIEITTQLINEQILKITY